MRTLLTLLSLALVPVAGALPASADQTYYCVQPVSAGNGASTPAACVYAPPAPDDSRAGR